MVIDVTHPAALRLRATRGPGEVEDEEVVPRGARDLGTPVRTIGKAFAVMTTCSDAHYNGSG